MFCQECGTNNIENAMKCNNCDSYLDLINSPLNGKDRVKVFSFFIFLILPWAWFGIGAVIILLTVIGIYVMKKDKSFLAIENSRKYIKIFLSSIWVIISFGLVISIIVFYVNNDVFYVSYHQYASYLTLILAIPLILTIIMFLRRKNINIILDFRLYFTNLFPTFFASSLLVFMILIFLDKRGSIELFFTLVLSYFSMVIILIFFLWIYDNLYFIPLSKHRDWVVKNGIFADNDSTHRIRGTENPCPYSKADELLKWKELLKKGIVTQDEYIKEKEKLLGDK